MALYFLRAGIGYALSGEGAVFAGAFRTEDGRADPGRCVGTVAPALRFLLLCDTGEGIDHDGNTDYHLCESWHLLCLGVQEDRQSLGTGNSALYEQQSGALIANTYSADLFQDQEITWGMLPGAVLMNGLIFGFFLLSKEFREKKE